MVQKVWNSRGPKNFTCFIHIALISPNAAGCLIEIIWAKWIVVLAEPRHIENSEQTYNCNENSTLAWPKSCIMLHSTTVRSFLLWHDQASTLDLRLNLWKVLKGIFNCSWQPQTLTAKHVSEVVLSIPKSNLNTSSEHLWCRTNNPWTRSLYAK